MGALAEEAEASEILKKLCNEEEERFAQSTFERITNETLEITAVAGKLEEESERIMIREFAMTRNQCLQSLQAEFARKYSSTTYIRLNFEQYLLVNKGQKLAWIFRVGY